jgi:hypothetical protein
LRFQLANFKDVTVFDNLVDLACIGNVSQRIGVKNQEVGESAGFDGPNLRIWTEDPCRVAGFVDGVFADTFEGMAGRERVAILLDLLGRKVRILLDEGAITTA